MKHLLLVVLAALALPACGWRKCGDCESCGVKKECRKRCHTCHKDRGCKDGSCHRADHDMDEDVK